MKIDHIPPEILSCIFLASLDDNAELYDTRYTPWLPAQVCRTWRFVAQGTPELWTNLLLSGYDGKPKRILNPGSNLQHTLDCFLKYSGEQPLRIRLFRRKGWGERNLALLAEMLWPKRARWESFTLIVNGRKCCDVWLRQARKESTNDMPLLRSLSLSAGTSQRSDDLDILRLFSNTPSLTKLSLVREHNVLSQAISTQNIHWNRLQTVSITGVLHLKHHLSLTTLLAALSHVITLNLVISQCWKDYDSPEASSPHPLPYLQGLALDGRTRYGDSTNVILSQITTPQLRALKLAGCWQVDTFHSFIERSFTQSGFCGIEHLALGPTEHEALDWALLADTISSMTALRVLDIGDLPTPLLTTYIIPRLMHPNACPSLESMQIYATCFRDGGTKELNRVLTSITEFLRHRFLGHSRCSTDTHDTKLLRKRHFRFTLWPPMKISQHTEALSETFRKVVSQVRMTDGNVLDIDVGVTKERLWSTNTVSPVTSCLGREWTGFSPGLGDAMRALDDLEKEDHSGHGCPM